MQQQQQQPAEHAFPLAGIAMEFLRKDAEGKERLSFCSQGKEALEVGLQALFSSGKPAAPALGELLGLAMVLEDQQASPGAAALIREAISTNAQALRALGISKSDGTVLRRSSTKLIGQETKDQAPVFGAATPKGAVSLSKLVDPMQLDRARAQQPKTLSTKPPPAQKILPSTGPNRRKFS